MGYEVHITKAKDWTGSKDMPVPCDAWVRLVDADPIACAAISTSPSRPVRTPPMSRALDQSRLPRLAERQ